MFFATQAITVLHWSRLSDIVGRKPIILVGLFGLSLSMFGFGLSTTYWSAAFWHVFIRYHQSPRLPLMTYPGEVSMEHLTATLASLKVLLRKSPTLQTLRR